MKRRLGPFLCLCLFISIAVGQASQTLNSTQRVEVQVLAITGATLIDGSGRAPVRDAVVIVAGDRISAAGPGRSVAVPPRARVIDARGLVIAPGFIDMHNHSERGIDADPSAATQVSQGITTVALGQDGGSEFPLSEYFSKRERMPVALNLLSFVGHATVRLKVMGRETNRRATPAEIGQMVTLVEQEMRDGAFGLSTGLEYEVAKHATTEEVIALARVAARHGGIYVSHIRDEADKTMEALAEAVRIGESARVPVHISHIKLGTVGVWGRVAQVARIVNGARSRGLDVTADCYPYTAWLSTIKVLVPSDRHDDPVDVARGLSDVGGATNITVVECEARRDYEFKTLDAIAREQRQTPVEIYMRIVREGGAVIVCRSMREEDVRAFYKQPWVMVSSDGGVAVPHPRAAGAYPRLLGRYVREQRWLKLEEAVRKMTSLPAARLGLKDRGAIRPGMKADLVLFDAEKIIDRSTFKEPGLIAIGVSRVFVNGVEVWRDGAVTGSKPGRVLRHGTVETGARRSRTRSHR
jgi:N-acyl-D-aspartate/D-glutamate deacylase